MLLEAALLLDRRGLPFRLEIVGAGPERARLEQQIETLGLGSRVQIPGMAVREEIRAAYQRASCFALACRVTGDGDRVSVLGSLFIPASTH